MSRQRNQSSSSTVEEEDEDTVKEESQDEDMVYVDRNSLNSLSSEEFQSQSSVNNNFSRNKKWRFPIR